MKRYITSHEDLIRMAWAAYEHGLAVGAQVNEQLIYDKRLAKIEAELRCQSREVPEKATHFGYKVHPLPVPNHWTRWVHKEIPG